MWKRSTLINYISIQNIFLLVGHPGMAMNQKRGFLLRILKGIRRLQLQIDTSQFIISIFIKYRRKLRFVEDHFTHALAARVATCPLMHFYFEIVASHQRFFFSKNIVVEVALPNFETPLATNRLKKLPGFLER